MLAGGLGTVRNFGVHVSPFELNIESKQTSREFTLSRPVSKLAIPPLIKQF